MIHAIYLTVIAILIIVIAILVRARKKTKNNIIKCADTLAHAISKLYEISR